MTYGRERLIGMKNVRQMAAPKSFRERNQRRVKQALYWPQKQRAHTLSRRTHPHSPEKRFERRTGPLWWHHDCIRPSGPRASPAAIFHKKINAGLNTCIFVIGPLISLANYEVINGLAPSPTHVGPKRRSKKPLLKRVHNGPPRCFSWATSLHPKTEPEHGLSGYQTSCCQTLSLLTHPPLDQSGVRNSLRSGSTMCPKLCPCSLSWARPSPPQCTPVPLP